MQKAKKKIFNNGLRVVTVPMKDNPTVTVLVLVGTGSDYENKEVNGISHFLEHMCFKGTEKRPTAQAISHELDALGCQSNAFTSHEYTGYYAKGDAKKFSKIFDIVSDIYLNSSLPKEEIEKEKGVIIEEINMYEDIPRAKASELFEELLYGNQPAGWSILGPKENILKINRDDFVKYKKEHYVANNTVIVVAGQINQSEVNKEVIKHFKNVQTHKPKRKIKTKISQSKPQVLVKNKKIDQTHFVLGVRSFPFGNKKNPVLSVLSGILGGGMSSRLFVKLREEMGVAYYVKSYNEPSLDRGSFQIAAGVNNKRVKEVIKEILLECRKLVEEPVDSKELNKVKSFLIGNSKLALESTDDIANFYGSQELLKKELKTLDEKIKKIKAVTSSDIQKMAKLIFKNENLNLSLVGPVKDKKQLEKILSF